MARTCFVATEEAEAAVEASSDRSEVLEKSSQVPAGVHDISTRPGRNASRRELTMSLPLAILVKVAARCEN